MYNCYNEAVRYLQGKPNPITYKPDGTIIDKTSHDDKVIKCLLGQYYYGIQAKKELYFKLVYMGIMEDKENKC